MSSLIMPFLITCLGFYLIWFALKSYREGIFVWSDSETSFSIKYSRQEDPGNYWICMSVNVAGGIISILLGGVTFVRLGIELLAR
jgi:hypothetical protein